MTVSDATVDLDLIAQRVLKLAEIATLDHLEALLESQAEGLLEWAAQQDAEAA
jgi:hypothetical protein